MALVISKTGQIAGSGDELAMYLKVFSGEIITAFDRSTKVINNHMVKTISAGKSASFPVIGRAKAKYLLPGNSLDDQREAIQNMEKVITIDGLLTADQVITDLYEAMSHYDVRQEYAKQMGEALAMSADGALLAELAKMATTDSENLTGLGKPVKLEKQLTASDIGVTETMGLTLVQMLLDLKAKWGEQYVPPTDRIVYMTPTGCSALVNAWIPINKEFGAVGTIVDGNVTKLAGFDIIEVPELTRGGADKTGMIGQSPQGHEFPSSYKDNTVFLAAHRTALGTLKLKDLKLEQGRRIEYQADEIVASYAMGHGGLRPEASAIGTISQSL